MIFSQVLTSEEIEELETDELEEYFEWVQERKKQLQRRAAWNRRLAVYVEQQRKHDDQKNIDTIKQNLIHG